MELYDIFHELNISYTEIHHEPVFTVEQAKNISYKIEGTGSKNLFLKSKKSQYYLVILEENKKLNFKMLAKELSVSGLTFASEQELSELLNLTAGSVSPFGIINDRECKVLLLIDKELEGKTLVFHPNTNEKSISLTFDDLIKFIEYERHDYLLI
ncbi:prolyl-tRNA synthetase associated domain-containing protein [Oribacterium sinus]|jgi:ybaK/prolyl-tRNA synthetase domain protein